MGKTCFLAITLFILIGTLSFSTNLYVDLHASGANTGVSWSDAWVSFSDVQWGAGSNQVGPGDTLFISGGTAGEQYTSQLNIGASGQSGLPITIRPGQDPGHNGMVTISIGSNTIDAIDANNDYITINGEGSDGNRRLKVMNCRMGIVSIGHTGIIVRHVMTENTDAPNGWSAIRLSSCSNSIIEWNLVRLAHSGSITLSGKGRPRGSSIVRYNDCENDDVDGLAIDSGTDIYSNRVQYIGTTTTNHPDGIVVQGSNNRIYLNQISGFNQNIYLDAVVEDSVNEVWSNLIYARSDKGLNGDNFHGIVVDGEFYSENANIYNNTVINGGIRALRDIISLRCKNNIIDTGFSNYGVNGSASYDIDYNYYVNGNSFSWNKVVFESLSLFQKNSGLDKNSRQGDPIFVNPSLYRYWLSSGSPCFKGGVVLGESYKLALANNARGASFPNPEAVERSGSWGVGAFSIGVKTKVGSATRIRAK